MAIRAAAAVAMNGGREDEKDGHGQDLVMPGFRFHPTEEELVEFYLRRKVEGKRFNVELITLLDLYRYDPWELPALATIGEKEWFFYVPRDRKYRNGDRPNRVTTSGYWKATGADRLIRSEGYRSIGLKKTLVFYFGKAPRGIRTSWIMNEYRLPQSEKDRYTMKAEISLCRVYKRAGIDDHCRLQPSSCTLPRTSGPVREPGGYGKIIINQSMPHRAAATDFQISAAMGDTSVNPEMDQRLHQVSARGIGNYIDALTMPTLGKHTAYSAASPMAPLSSTMTDEDAATLQSRDVGSLFPACALSAPSTSMPETSVDELNRLVELNSQSCLAQPNHFFPLTPQSSQLPPTLNPSSLANLTNKMWEWNHLSL